MYGLVYWKASKMWKKFNPPSPHQRMDVPAAESLANRTLDSGQFRCQVAYLHLLTMFMKRSSNVVFVKQCCYPCIIWNSVW